MKASHLYSCLALMPALWLAIGFLMPAKPSAAFLPPAGDVRLVESPAPQPEVVMVTIQAREIQ